jgi:hypothetical protein
VNPDDLDQGSMDDDEEIDLSKSKKTNFVFDNGDYEMVLVEVVRDVSQNSGNKMLVFSWRGGDELKNAKFKQFVALTEGALWRLTAILEALDLQATDGKIKVSEIISKGPGRRAMNTLKKERRDGVERSNIQNNKRHPDGPGEGRGLPF